MPNYYKKIILLADSRKPGGKCMAGIELIDDVYGEWIRPVSIRQGAEISVEECRYENGTEPKILDVINIPMLATSPRLHQTENHIIDSEYYWVKTEEASYEDLENIMNEPQNLWINNSSSYKGTNDRVEYASAAQLTKSLYLIKPDNVRIQVLVPGASFGDPKRAVRSSFDYNGTHYNFRVTDPIAERTFLARANGTYSLEQDVYFCVSLAEAHTDGYCYKLVASIISEQPL